MRDPPALEIRHRGKGAVGAHEDVHRLRIQAAYRAERGVRPVRGKASPAFVGVERGVALRERERDLAAAQQPEVFLAAPRDQGQHASAGAVGKRLHEPQVLAVLGPGGDRVACRDARQARPDSGVGRGELLLDHRDLLRRCVLLDGLHDLAHGVQDRRRPLRGVRGVGRRHGRPEAAGCDGRPAIALALVERGAVRAEHVAGLVAAGRDPGDALRPGAERRHQPGDARRIPGPEIEIALELQLRVEIDDAPRLARGRLGIGLRAAAREGREGHGSRGQRLGDALADAALQRVGAGAAAAAGGRQDHEDGDKGTHVQPPMNGSASMDVSTTTFMRSMKNAPASGTIR